MTVHPILEVSDVKKYFVMKNGLKKDVIKAVDRISFSLEAGKTLGIVGESGSGKSTLGRAIVQLLHDIEGEVLLNGKSIIGLKRKELQKLREDIQVVFQDPYASLDPKQKIKKIIAEPLKIHKKPDREKSIHEIIELVGLPVEFLERYPHELSGGQRQRIGIARALALSPSLILFDEAVSALDVSVQAQIINLIKKLQNQLKLTYLFITHDLSVLRQVADEVIVIYRGKLVEKGKVEEIIDQPVHPYTKLLVSAIPEIGKPIVLDEAGEEEKVINQMFEEGEDGCPFYSRCEIRKSICLKKFPEISKLSETHDYYCHGISNKKEI
ncbi:oligopeptide/dipeptide ABC transporter ATP-binding protein [Oceanobacillus sojae]|uniref:oligopeptide/dipeptide ABC transporter ATP-binding protein n=1 Tax=Oceanobacillus sojae TaxID=582851 RepID=UPI0020C9EFA9|nr:ABC transporter ATP-binding protein [Oceanobacillus sojae]